MDGTGESDVIDFNFDELEFIDGELGDLEDPNTKTAEQIAAEELAAAAEAEIAAAAEQEGKTAEEIEAERIAAEAAGGAPEGESPESVGGGSTDDKAGDGTATSPKLYQAFTDTLREKGVLSSVDESSLKDIKDVDSLVDLIKAQIKAEEYSDLDDIQKEVLTGMRAGVSSDTADEYKRAMTNLNSIDDAKINADKQVRFDLMYQDFLAKGLTKEKATKYSNMSFTAGDDLKDAIEAKQSLVEAVTKRYESSKQKELDAKQAVKDKKTTTESELKKLMMSNKDIMKGIKITENVKKEVYEAMVKTISTNPETGAPENELMRYQRENPLDYSHKLYYLFKVTNGFKDMDFFKGKKMSESVKDLETALKQSTHVSGGGSPSFADDGETHSFDIGELVLPD